MSDAQARYDLFLSYDSRDFAIVESFAGELRERGLSVFLDRWYIPLGTPWPQVLESTLQSCRAVAVVLGTHGMGTWQMREVNLALVRQSREPGFPVIPLRLPGAADPPLSFLSLNHWVDLNDNPVDPLLLEVLIAAVRGEPPGPELRDRARAAMGSICPYRGLKAFREEDAPFFFGRDVFVDRLVRTVAINSLVAVVGPSGSGKSSVVRAGLVSRLRHPDSKVAWEVAIVVPGNRPMHALANALLPLLAPNLREMDRLYEGRRLAEFLDKEGPGRLCDVVNRVFENQHGTRRLLLVVDQWEELYAASDAAWTDNNSVQRFVDELLYATANGPLTVVLTVRGDFYGHVLAHRALSDRLQGAVVNLGPMIREELRQAVVCPAEKVGLGFEAGLTDRILDEIGEEPGNLALLEIGLSRLWEQRHGGHLLHEAYKDMGGMRCAIVTQAEEVYTRLSPAQQELVRQLFLALVRPGEGTEDTRRRAPLAEIGVHASVVVQHMVAARLVVTGRDEATGEDSVEVAHEALIRHWPRLRGWVDERRADLRLVLQFKVAAEEWQKNGRDTKYLWSDERAVEVARAATRLAPTLLLTDVERDFLGPVDLETMLKELESRATSHERRALIGIRLAVFGDARPGVGLRSDGLPDIVWCAVPGGSITLELDHFAPTKPKRWMRWLRSRTFNSPPFSIAKYCVTWAQYRAFIEAEDGYSSPRWWGGLNHRSEPGRQRTRRDNHPAENVSWFDAIAYCRWLSAKLGYEVRLPTEWEWQQAATGGDPRRTYPWGDWDEGLANTYESGLSCSTAVGMYPRGTWLGGPLDMAGNVWEWCLNKYADPADTRIGQGDVSGRVLRGGSWGDRRDFACCAYRHDRPLPDGRDFDVGFRVLRASPIE